MCQVLSHDPVPFSPTLQMGRLRLQEDPGSPVPFFTFLPYWQSWDLNPDLNDSHVDILSTTATGLEPWSSLSTYD